MYVCYIYIHTYIYIQCIHIYNVCIYIYVYICVYIYIYTCINSAIKPTIPGIYYIHMISPWIIPLISPSAIAWLEQHQSFRSSFQPRPKVGRENKGGRSPRKMVNINIIYRYIIYIYIVYKYLYKYHKYVYIYIRISVYPYNIISYSSGIVMGRSWDSHRDSHGRMEDD